jgi:hypothetical protein
MRPENGQEIYERNRKSYEDPALLSFDPISAGTSFSGVSDQRRRGMSLVYPP